MVKLSHETARAAVLHGALQAILDHPEEARKYAKAALEANPFEAASHYQDLVAVARAAVGVVQEGIVGPDRAERLEALERKLRHAGFFAVNGGERG